MNFVTTNIRLSEEDYLRLKAEAARSRVSFAQIIRQKVTDKPRFDDRQKKAAAIIRKLNILAKQNAKYMKNIDGVSVIRQMRYQDP